MIARRTRRSLPPLSRLGCLLAMMLCALASPAQLFGGGVNKDMVQLQTQIQQLQDAVARLQQSNDERMGVLKDLVQQNSDQVNRMSASVDSLNRALSAQQTAGGGKLDQVSGQVQALNDSVDELKARMNRLEKLLGDVENQTQSINSTLQSNPPAGGGGSLGNGGGVSPQPVQPAQPQPVAPDPNYAPGSPLTTTTTVPRKPSAAVSELPPASPSASSGVPVTELYRSAYSDYMAAKYPVASSEFGDVIKAYPDNQLSGNSYYYMGEIEYRNGRYAAAAKDYDHVLEQFPDNNKIPASHLHKGEALLQLKETDAGVRELRALITRFPNSPEAVQAKAKLNAMGVPIKPRT